MSEPPDPAEQASCRAPTAIRIVDLHKSFGDEHVLDGVAMNIYAGGTVAIVDGSGCSKTVLLDQVPGQLRPHRGHIAVVDHDDPRQPLRRPDGGSFAEFAANASPIVRPNFELMPVLKHGHRMSN